MVKFFFGFWMGVFLLVFSAVANATAVQAYSKIRPLIMQVKTSASSSLEKSSYGTGFVVDRSGLIVTNYHVVAASIWNPEKLKVFVVLDKTNLDAKVIHVDYINDLALLKVDHNFPGQIQLASGYPEKGAEIFSLGLPEDIDWSVVTGIYNGIVTRGAHETFYMSTPINSGMSGGPIVNTSSEVLAVNASKLVASSQISFGVPLQALKAFLRESRDNKLTSKQFFIERLRSQLTEYQEKLSQQIQKSFSKKKRLVNHVEVPDHSEILKCWGSATTVKDLRYQVESETCSNEFEVGIDDHYGEGSFKSEIAVIKNQSLNPLAWQMVMTKSSAVDVGRAARDYNKDETINYLPLKCLRENVLTQAPVPGRAAAPEDKMLITICSQASMQLAGLFDFYVGFAKRLSSDIFVTGNFEMAGFTKDNMKSLVNLIVAQRFELKP